MIIKKLGDYGQIATPVAAAIIAISKKDKDGVVRLALLLVVNQIAVGLLKLIPVKRPNGSMRSFPSGHTAAAFLGAGFMICRYGKDSSIMVIGSSVASLAVATFVGFSRIYCNAHWKSDVIAGAALGLSCAYFSK